MATFHFDAYGRLPDDVTIICETVHQKVRLLYTAPAVYHGVDTPNR
jgi:hypothetical protein